jgi:surfeit locus 1 family protein
MTEPHRAGFDRLRGAGLLLPSLMALAGLLVLVSLGTWQLQRKAWKDGLIAELGARIRSEPVPLEEALRRWRERQDIEYLRVRLRGVYQHAGEIHLHALERGAAGWHVIAPLITPGGTVVFVNRGFVPHALKDRATRAAGLIAGEAEFNGLVRAAPLAKAAFVPENAPGRNEWYWPDMPAMLRAAFANTERPYAPFLVEMERVTVPVPPAGGATRLDIPNRHLEYALTWFGLAVTLAGVYVAFAAARLRRAG